MSDVAEMPGQVAMRGVSRICSLSAVITRACKCGASLMVDGILRSSCPGCGAPAITEDCGVMAKWVE